MNRKASYLWIACLFLVGAVPAHSQTAPAATPKETATKEEKLPTAEELSEKCAKGSGGKEAWAKLQTMVLTGTVDIPTFNVSGTVEVYAKRPNKVLHISSVADGQFIQKQGFDGRSGWSFDTQKGLKTLEGADLEQAKIEGIFDTDVRLKEVYPDMKVTGRAKVGDRDAFTVLAHEPGGKALTMYMDAQTGMRIAEDVEGPDDTGTVVKTKLLFEDFRKAGEIQIPYRIRISAPTVTVVIQIEGVKLNETLDDSKFAAPAN